jgi:hypothetical protein
MTVSTTTTSVSYTGNGSTTSFAVTFPFFGTGSTAELEVVERTIATGAEVTKSYSTHYTVTGGDGSTGAVVAGSAPADTVQWHIRRKTTTTQTSNYVTNDPFPADTLEGDIDRLAMSGQERDGDISQAFRFPDTYTGGASVTMPEPTANKLLQWNSDGDALANSSEVALPASLTASNFIQVNAGATNYDMKTAAQVFTALLATEGNGMIAHAGSGAAEPRTITGTSNQITLTNGDGVSGNPTVSIPDAITFTGKTVTGGTYNSIVATSTMAGDPSSAMHIATKQYVDGVAAGLSKRATVHLATTGAITISTALKSDASPTPTIDGVAIQAGDLVLVKDQGSSDREQNGIYVCGSTPARDDLFDTYDEHPGTLVAVEEGSTNADKMFLCTSNKGGTLNTTDILWTNIVPGSGGTVTNIATAGLATGGAITSTGTITVSINGQSSLGASPVAADEFAIYDADATAHKKITTTQLFGSTELTATAREYTKTQNFNATALSDGANISWDLSQNQVASVTLAGNRTLDAPSNQVAGATYILIVKQDGSGNRTLDTTASAYKFPGGTEPTLSAGANAVDILSFVSDGSSMFGVAQLNFS